MKVIELNGVPTLVSDEGMRLKRGDSYPLMVFHGKVEDYTEITQAEYETIMTEQEEITE